jgi:hypothetical protein
MGKRYQDGIKYRILSLTIQRSAKPMNSIKDDKYLDFCLFALSALLYAFWHAFFPLLLLSFVFLWYRRELAWRIKRGKPKFFGVYSVWRKKPIRLSMLDFGFLVWYGIY